jgi:hypothetical protein
MVVKAAMKMREQLVKMKAMVNQEELNKKDD